MMEQELQDLINHMKQTASGCSTSQTIDVCPKCKGSGYELVEIDGNEYATECSCGLLLNDRQDKLLKFADIPFSFKDNKIENFRYDCYSNESNRKLVKSAIKISHYFVDNIEEMQEKGMGLYFYSAEKGSGKTRLASSIGNELIAKGKQVKFSTSVDVINAIKSTWNDKRSPQAENETDLLKALQDTEILIIDDFGTEQAKEWVFERWYSIINDRYVNNKITILTSNMSLDDLKYDSRITNRLKERTYQIAFPEESVRTIIADCNKKRLIKNMTR